MNLYITISYYVLKAHLQTQRGNISAIDSLPTQMLNAWGLRCPWWGSDRDVLWNDHYTPTSGDEPETEPTR